MWNPRGESKADFRVSQKVKAKIPNLYWRIRSRFDKMDTEEKKEVYYEISEVTRWILLDRDSR